jgi:hypothetical protein
MISAPNSQIFLIDSGASYSSVPDHELLHDPVKLDPPIELRDSNCGLIYQIKQQSPRFDAQTTWENGP